MDGNSTHTKEDLGLTLLGGSIGRRALYCFHRWCEPRKRLGPMPSFGKPGDIDSLVNCMKQAIQMKDSQYQELSQLAKVDLEQYVRPLDEYAKSTSG